MSVDRRVKYESVMRTVDQLLFSTSSEDEEDEEGDEDEEEASGSGVLVSSSPSPPPPPPPLSTRVGAGEVDDLVDVRVLSSCALS